MVTGTETSANRDGFGLRRSAINMIAAGRHMARNAGNEMSGVAIAMLRRRPQRKNAAQSTTPQATT